MSRNNDNNGKTRGPTHWIKIKNVEGKFVTVAGVWRDTKNGEERLRGKRLPIGESRRMRSSSS